MHVVFYLPAIFNLLRILAVFTFLPQITTRKYKHVIIRNNNNNIHLQSRHFHEFHRKRKKLLKFALKGIHFCGEAGLLGFAKYTDFIHSSSYWCTYSSGKSHVYFVSFPFCKASFMCVADTKWIPLTTSTIAPKPF